MRKYITCTVFIVSDQSIDGEFSKTEVLLHNYSWVSLSVTSRREILTSRREILTSRRQNVTPLPRRDVNHHVATSIFEASVTSRREISRRDVSGTTLGHVVT